MSHRAEGKTLGEAIMAMMSEILPLYEPQPEFFEAFAAFANGETRFEHKDFSCPEDQFVMTCTEIDSQENSFTKAPEDPAPTFSPLVYFSTSGTIRLDACAGVKIGEITQPIGKYDKYGRLFAAAPDLLAAITDLTKNVNLSKLNVRKDYSLLLAHAASLKAIAKAKGGVA